MAAKLSKPKNPRRLTRFGAPIRLTSEVSDSDEPVWIQIAYEGTWSGHPSGEKVEFDRKVFSQIIENFRAHPWYHKGEDGVGDKPVIPYDYEHASEMAPTEGSIPATGAPAPAWALELELRDGDAGKLELWALTQLSSQAREQIRAGGYLSTSVAVWMNAKDNVSGKPIGALLTSIAFTNHPFVKGMAPIAASMGVYGKAETPEEFIVGLRDLLGLPSDADVAAVTLELEALRVAVSEGFATAACPEGYGWLVNSMRCLLGLRVLATTDEIFASAGQALGTSANPTASAPQPAPEEAPMTAPAINTLAQKLADLFNCRDAEPLLLAAAEKAKQKGDTLDQLIGLFESDDMASLLGDAAKVIEKAKRADEYLAGLTSVRDRLSAAEKKEAESEVEQVAASMGLTGDTLEKVKSLLLTERLACDVDDSAKREEKLVAFRAKYPSPRIDPSKTLLTQPLVAGRNGVQLIAAAPAAAPQAGQAGEHVTLFAAYPGRNDVEKAQAYLCDKQPGFRLNDRATQVRLAGKFVRTGTIAA